jgi:hypothetical protein
MAPIEQKGRSGTIWYSFCLLNRYGIYNHLEDGKSVSGRAESDNWPLSVDHRWNGVVVVLKKVVEQLR